MADEGLEAAVDEALSCAHLPALLMSLVHLTGNAGLLTAERRPNYEFVLSNGFDGGYPAKVQEDIRRRARTAILAHLDGTPLPPPPSDEVVRRMMDWIAGADIPRRYFDFLLDELQLSGRDTKAPDWSSPSLKAAAAKTRVIVVGAGMSGLLTGIRLQQAGVDFTILEKNPEAGGTWFENVYPGCRVDNPNHMYSYSFEPNHDFPQYYSTQPVLLEYFQRVCDRYGLRERIRFSTELEEARWDEAASLWRVTVRTADGRQETLEANALITAVGQLNRPRYPDIEGLESFAGPSWHSARWRNDVDVTGKRVAVIGTGASAFQFVPEIAPNAAHLEVFQRTPPWTLPGPTYHDDVPEGKKWLIRHVPFYGKWYRFWLFWRLTDGLIGSVTADPDWSGGPGAVGKANAELRGMLEGAIRAQAGDDPDLLAKLIPAYPPGGKRGLVDNGVWVKALKRDNVDLITTPIAKIAAEGIVTRDGELHRADVLIFGTGFHASRFLHPMRIFGRDGVELHDAWAGDARAYLGITTPGFPNFFMIYGPNTNIVVNGSIIFFSECAVRYIVGCLKLLAQTGAQSLEVRREVHDAFNARVDAENARMAWGAPQVTSWYKNPLGRVSQNWPFPLVDYWNATVEPDPEDFIIAQNALAQV
ncbi:MAG TPA: NAD(P)-binding domain-containing protein [Caulobacteraceae bacterium]|nr:NAD(P)-binding domain-containing protein [Caulobacteraceae bacterium]